MSLIPGPVVVSWPPAGESGPLWVAGSLLLAVEDGVGGVFRVAEALRWRGESVISMLQHAVVGTRVTVGLIDLNKDYN